MMPLFNTLNASQWTLLAAKFFGKKKYVNGPFGTEELRVWLGKEYLMDYKRYLV